MIALGLAEDELALLREAQDQSDTLVALEEVAMRAINDSLAVADEQYRRQGESNRDMALRLLHGEEYHKSKIKIMMPINAFFIKLDERTEAEYMQYAKQSTILIATCVVLIVLVGILALVAAFLDKRIRKREQALFEKVESALRHAQKMEAVGQLTGGIAHDFNNLLTVVIGNLQMIEEYVKQDDALTASISDALDAAFRGADLTRRLLAFSRRQILTPKVIAIDKLVIDLEPLLRRTLGEQVSLTTTDANDLWLTEVDPSQLENAVVNLCINARDAMPNGGELAIETRNCTLDNVDAGEDEEVIGGEYVLLMVSDNGAGIKKEILRRVFEPFYTTKEIGTGSGLGLSMVYGFVKQSQGHIEIESEEGHGTTVRIYLPKSQSTTECIGGATIGTAGMPRGHETVLTVEDDVAVRKLTVELLTSLGYRVLEAGTGAEASVALEEHEDIDLVFSDIVMPGGMTGVELESFVHQSYPNLKVLLTSGFSDSSVFDIGFLQHGNDVLKKPYQNAELANAVRDILDRK